jgi:ubiquinone/menaquinone biosynthesis C-methylase UbiE
LSLRLKEFAKKIIPKPFQKRLVGVWNTYSKIGTSRAVTAIESATDSRQWLKLANLEELNSKYQKPEKYAYDPDTTNKRGLDRANEILTILKSVPELTEIPHGFKSLELGALDAMTSFHLQQKGFRTAAVDITDSHFTKDVRSAGVSLQVMDASSLLFKDGYFDFVFSYNSFEHFEDPEKVLTESLRVLHPGGYFYVNFGPLYPSPLGLHGHESIPVPYMQFLFPRDLLEKFCADNKLGTIEFDTLNGWSASQFRELWESYRDKLDKVKYSERLDTYGIELLIKYPECFKGKVSDPNDLFISAIEGLWRKK